MAHFIISFRIKSDTSYQSRYDSFTSRVAEIASRDGGAWEETSSFFAIKANYTAERLCDDLYLNSEFSAALDIMIVIDLDRREKATKGEIQYPNTLGANLGF